MDWDIWLNRKKIKFKWGKVGCWIRRSDFDSPYAFNKNISWFVCEDRFLNQVINRVDNRKIILGYTGSDERVITDSIIYRANQISGVIWNYTNHQDKSHILLSASKVHCMCKSLKLPFGIVVPAHPNNSAVINGIHFGKAQAFCDFLMPMLYCQRWQKDITKTRCVYLMELKAASVPIIPIIARKILDDKANDPLLTDFDLISIYKPLMFTSFAVWNTSTSDSTFWKTAKNL